MERHRISHGQRRIPSFSFCKGLQRYLAMLMLCSVTLLAACTGKVDLLTGITESDGNEALSALLDAGLNADKQVTKDGTNIRIASNDVGRALETLAALGLPRERFDGMGEIFRKEGLVSSPLEERARYIYALSQELANTLTQVDGVLTARVHVVLPERGSVGEATLPSTAAVFIKHRRDYTLDALQPQIRRLVTHSIPGLREDQVTVVLFPAQPVTSGVAHTSSLGTTDASLQNLIDLAGPSARWALLLLVALAILGLGLTGWLAWTRLRSGIFNERARIQGQEG